VSVPTEAQEHEPEALPDDRRFGMTRRARVLALSATSVLVLVGVALLLPVPFVKLAPGPVFNVIGEHDGRPVIAISGTQTYPTTGALDMTTVWESGGPRGGLTFVDALASWFDTADAVVPRELLYPDDVSGDDVKARQAALFSTSESDAISAAMSYLNRPVTTEIIVTAVFADSPADGNLKPRDSILAVDGTAVQSAQDVVTAVRSKPIGSTITFQVRRGDATGAQSTSDILVVSAANPDDPELPYVGVTVGPYSVPDFSIDFTLEDVGGPSAGLMFATGIVDKLTPEDLTRGRHIAGTGTIDPDGSIGSIGGIRQKLAGSRNAGAELFLMPQQHCKESAGHVPDGLTVVPVTTLSEAIAAIKAWHEGAALPTCTVGA
jgi:Lon-like protease